MHGPEHCRWSCGYDQCEGRGQESAEPISAHFAFSADNFGSGKQCTPIVLLSYSEYNATADYHENYLYRQLG